MSSENLYHHLHKAVLDAVEFLKNQEVIPSDVSMENISVEQPKDPTHGDFATNAALVLAKPAKKNPRELAEKIAENLKKSNVIDSVDIAGPGFINLRLTAEAFEKQTRDILVQKSGYGKSDFGNNNKALVEFVSINPTGPIHVGHGRNAVVGDTLCRLLEKTGWQVYREYLVNDFGNQIKSLALSVHARYRQLFGDEAAIPADGYVGDYIIEIAEKLKEKDGDKWRDGHSDDDICKNLRKFCVDACMSMIQKDLEVMGIHFHRFHSEYEMHEKGDPLAEAVRRLEEKGEVFKGKLPPPKGKEAENYVAEELTLFKATKYGAEQDKPIYNRRGEPTYFGQDIAYHNDKLQRDGGQDWLITVVAIQQTGNFVPLVWALEALTGKKGSLTPFYHGMVKTLRDGQPVKLSKRAGNIVALADVLEEVGSDAYRFHMLLRKADTELVFDLAKAVEKNNENPVFYAQYAHARMCAVKRQQIELGIEEQTPEEGDLTLLTSDPARAVMKTLCRYPMMIERAARTQEVHRVAFYALDLAADFHSWYNAEKFLDAGNLPLTQARLALMEATRIVLVDALALAGVGAPESM